MDRSSVSPLFVILPFKEVFFFKELTIDKWTLTILYIEYCCNVSFSNLQNFSNYNEAKRNTLKLQNFKSNRKIPINHTWLPRNIFATTGWCSLLNMHFSGILSSSDKQTPKETKTRSILSTLCMRFWEGTECRFILQKSPIQNCLHSIKSPKFFNLRKCFTLCMLLFWGSQVHR